MVAGVLHPLIRVRMSETMIIKANSYSMMETNVGIPYCGMRVDRIWKEVSHFSDLILSILDDLYSIRGIMIKYGTRRKVRSYCLKSTLLIAIDFLSDFLSKIFCWQLISFNTPFKLELGYPKRPAWQRSTLKIVVQKTLKIHFFKVQLDKRAK